MSYDCQGSCTLRCELEPCVHRPHRFSTEDKTITWATHRMVTVPMCPDLLRYDQLGEADNLRGKIVRAFFWIMQAWKTGAE